MLSRNDAIGRKRRNVHRRARPRRAVIGKLAEDVRSRDAQAADAGLSRHDGGVQGDAVKAHGGDNAERAAILQRLRQNSPRQRPQP